MTVEIDNVITTKVRAMDTVSQTHVAIALASSRVHLLTVMSVVILKRSRLRTVTIVWHHTVDTVVLMNIWKKADLPGLKCGPKLHESTTVRLHYLPCTRIHHVACVHAQCHAGHRNVAYSMPVEDHP